MTQRGRETPPVCAPTPEPRAIIDVGERIAKITKQRDEFIIKANEQIAYFNGQIAALQELISEQPKITEGQDPPPNA